MKQKVIQVGPDSDGDITDQNPEGGAPQAPSTLVTIWVGLYIAPPPPPPTPITIE